MTDATIEETPVPGASAEPPRMIIAPLVALAAFMEVLDISIANVSLRHIAGNLAASQDESTWILTSYLVTNAIILPVSGWFSQVFGRKRFYLACIVGFGVSSLLCGLAPSLELLILARAVQGITGGGLQPSSQAILADSFPPQQRGMAFAFYGIAVVFAPAIGPTLGGWITDNFSWRWVFLINVPVSFVLFFLINAMIHDPPQLVAARIARLREGINIDYIGFALLALGLGLMQFVLDKGEEDDWFSSHIIATSSIISAVSLVVFVFWELRQRQPIVELSLLKDKNFAMGNILMLMLGFILLGSTAILPLYMQSLLGYTATDAGMALSPGGFAIMLLMPVIGRLVTRVDVRYMIALGLAISAASLFAMTRFTLEIDFWTIATYRIVQAAGLAFLFIPINAAAYASVPPDKNAAASSFINLSRNIGGSIGISVLTTVLSQRSQYHQNMLVESITPYSAPYLDTVHNLQAMMMRHGGTAAEALERAQGLVSQSVLQQAQLLGYLDDFLLLAVVFAALIPFVFLMRRPPVSGGPVRVR
jgi:MFS transporter, DHA2 family, multidrug resistance protein